MKNKAFSLIEISITFIIIGILFAGISQSIELISETSLRTARNLSKSSRIIRIDDLSLWLDATNEKAFDKPKSENSIISIWKDTNPKSTSPIFSSSLSTNFNPTYLSTIINDLPAVNFKKTSSSLGNCITIGNDFFINNSEDFVLYLIFSPNTLDDGIILEKNNATATTFPFSLELNGGYYKFSIKDSSTTISVLGAKKANINKPNLIRLSRIKGSQIEITVNGVSSTESDTLTSTTLNTAELAIGCRNGATPANFINGNIGEIAFFDRNLNDKVKSEIEEYFYKKWKMKKYEGSLVSAELPCTVPSSENTDLSITTVQPSTIPQDISCKSGYSGTPKYTCINGVFNIASGSCTQITSCNVSDCASENYAGTKAVTDINCVNLKSIIGNTVNINATGTYITKSTGYYPEGLNGPEYSLRWKCKSDGTMDIDIEKGCIFFTNQHYTSHGGGSSTQHVFDGKNWTFTGNVVFKYCCSGLLYYDNPCAPWFF